MMRARSRGKGAVGLGDCLENRVVCYKGGAAMKIFLSVIIIFMVGLCAMVFGIEQFGGYPELGTVVEIAVASGFIIYFQGQSKKK